MRQGVQHFAAPTERRAGARKRCRSSGTRLVGSAKTLASVDRSACAASAAGYPLLPPPFHIDATEEFSKPPFSNQDRYLTAAAATTVKFAAAVRTWITEAVTAIATLSG